MAIDSPRTLLSIATSIIDRSAPAVGVSVVGHRTRRFRLLALAALLALGPGGLGTAGAAVESSETMDSIETVAYSPDGKSVAAGGRDRLVRLWDSETGTATRTLRGHSGAVVAIAFSPDGAFLASGDGGQDVILWDLQTGKRVRTLEGHIKGRAFHRLNAIVYSPDGATIAVADHGGYITLWDAGTGTIRRTLDGQGIPAQGLAFSPDGTMLAVGFWDKTLKICDPRTGRLLRSIAHEGIVRSVAFTGDGGIVTGTEVGTVRLWDAQTGKPRKTLLKQDHPIYFVMTSLDRTVIGALPLSSLGPMLWETRTWTRIEPRPPARMGVLTAALSPDGRRVVLGGGGGTKSVGNIEVRDARSGALVWAHSGFLRRVNSVAFSPDGATIAGAIGGYRGVDGFYAESGRAELWDARTGKSRRTLAALTNWGLAIAYAPDGKTIAIGGVPHAFGLWNVETGGLDRTWKDPGDVASIAFSPDGKSVASGHRGTSEQGGELIVRNVGEAAEHWRQAVPRSSITAVAYSPDGAWIAAGSVEHRHGVGGETEVRVWEARNGRLVHLLTGETGGAASLAFSPDSTILAGVFPTGTIRLWDRRTGRRVRSWKGHPPGRVATVAFAPDGKSLASASFRSVMQTERPGEVKFWDVATGESPRAIAGDSDNAYSLAFSPDLTRLAIGRDDGTVTTLDLATPREPASRD
jgi:WD40 repeat protein